MNSKTNAPNLMWLFVLFAVNLLLGCGSSSAEKSSNPPPEPPIVTQSGALCGEIRLSTRPLLYCYEDRVGHGQSSETVVPVIYYFHGLGGNVQDIFEGEAKTVLDALARVYGDRLPIIVSLSLGSDGVIGDDATEIVTAGLPAIDQFLASGKTFRRTLMGGSMGGHNSLRLTAEGGFVSAAALCPAVATFNGHNRAEVDSYIARNEPLLDRDFFEQALASYQKQLTTAEIWARNNPLNLISEGVYSSIPIYLSTGIEDQLGFIEGARAFQTRAQQNGVQLDYHEVHGPHCAFDLPALVRFLRNHT